jgi:2-dehydropantoate 2-reductase
MAAVLGEDRVIQGVTSQGATLLGPGRLRHAGEGPTQLATRPTIGPAIEEIAYLFSRVGLAGLLTDDLDSLLWGKLIINVGINALSAILRVTNGQVAEIEPAAAVMTQAVTEAVQVAEALGIRLPNRDPIYQVRRVAAATTINRSSMLADVLRGVPTEIEAINGAVVREGRRLGLATPVNELLLQLVKAIEQSYPQRVS